MDGKKYDTGKPRTDLLPADALTEIAKVLTEGAKKYDPWNWAKGMKWSRLHGAVLRHVFAWSKCEDSDPETGLPHLAHAACGLLFLIEYALKNKGEDDRHRWGEDENKEEVKTEIEQRAEEVIYDPTAEKKEEMTKHTELPRAVKTEFELLEDVPFEPVTREQIDRWRKMSQRFNGHMAKVMGGMNVKKESE